MNKMSNERTVNTLVDIGAVGLILALILFASNNMLLVYVGVIVYILFAVIFALISLKQEKTSKDEMH